MLYLHAQAPEMKPARRTPLVLDSGPLLQELIFSVQISEMMEITSGPESEASEIETTEIVTHFGYSRLLQWSVG